MKLVEAAAEAKVKLAEAKVKLAEATAEARVKLVEAKVRASEAIIGDLQAKMAVAVVNQQLAVLDKKEEDDVVTVLL